MRVARALAIAASVAGAALLLYARRRRRAALRCQPCSLEASPSTPGRTGSRQTPIAFDGVDTPEPRQPVSVFDGVDKPRSSPVRALRHTVAALSGRPMHSVTLSVAPHR